jgi:hypothetical protein
MLCLRCFDVKSLDVCVCMYIYLCVYVCACACLDVYIGCVHFFPKSTTARLIVRMDSPLALVVVRALAVGLRAVAAAL